MDDNAKYMTFSNSAIFHEYVAPEHVISYVPNSIKLEHS